MQKLESENNETDFSDLPDLISISDDGKCDDSDNLIISKTFQVFSRLSDLNHGFDKVVEEIKILKKESADITLLTQSLYLLLSKRSSCCENIVLNMEENSEEGELCCEHFSSPLYTKIPSSDIRFYLEDDEQEDEDNDPASEDEEDPEDVQFSEDEEEVNDDPNGLGESTIFD
jgi:hypothetical protein